MKDAIAEVYGAVSLWGPKNNVEVKVVSGNDTRFLGA